MHPSTVKWCSFDSSSHFWDWGVIISIIINRLAADWNGPSHFLQLEEVQKQGGSLGCCLACLYASAVTKQLFRSYQEQLCCLVICFVHALRAFFYQKKKEKEITPQFLFLFSWSILGQLYAICIKLNIIKQIEVKCSFYPPPKKRLRQQHKI